MILNTKYKLGFTLIELLVTTSIILLLAGFGLASWQTFNQQQTLDAAAQDLKNNLRLARSWAMAVKKSCDGPAGGYQVSFTDRGYSIQEKCGGVLINPAQNFSYPSEVIGSVPIPNSFIFQPLTGTTNLSAEEVTISLSLSLGGRPPKTVTIRKNGEIE